MRYEGEFAKLERRGPDYDELLRGGSIIRRVDNPAEWRAEMRAKARSDKPHIRTGGYDDGTVWAALIDRKVSVDELGEVFKLMDLQSEAEARANLHDHKVRWLRVEGKRAIARCSRCGARLYLDGEPTPFVMDGEIFEGECS